MSAEKDASRLDGFTEKYASNKLENLMQAYETAHTTATTILKASLSMMCDTEARDVHINYGDKAPTTSDGYAWFCGLEVKMYNTTLIILFPWKKKKASE